MHIMWLTAVGQYWWALITCLKHANGVMWSGQTLFDFLIKMIISSFFWILALTKPTLTFLKFVLNGTVATGYYITILMEERLQSCLNWFKWLAMSNVHGPRHCFYWAVSHKPVNHRWGFFLDLLCSSNIFIGFSWGQYLKQNMTHYWT